MCIKACTYFVKASDSIFIIIIIIYYYYLLYPHLASLRTSDGSKLKEVLVGLNKQEAVLDRVMVLST